MKLSIIVPAFNVSPYITRCVESCENINMVQDDFEIVIVDDGSTDNTRNVVSGLQEQFPNIKYIRQDNAGQSAARNSGLKQAKGEYIWYVDADDYVVEGDVRGLLQTAIEEKLDVQAFNLQFVDVEGAISAYNIKYEKSGKIYDNNEFSCCVGMPHSPCIAFLRKDFLIANNLFFRTGIYFEDFELMVRLYCLAERSCYNDVVLYTYYQREGSTMKSSNIELNRKRSRDLLNIADSLYNFRQTYLNDKDSIFEKLTGDINFAVFQSLTYYSRDAYPLGVLKSKPYYPLLISKMTSLSEKLKCILVNLSVHLYLAINKLK